MQDYRQSSEYNDYFAKKGWVVEKTGETVILIKKIPLLGSIIKIQHSNEVPFTEIDKLAKIYKAMYVLVEANTKVGDPAYEQLVQDFKLHDYKNVSFSLCPTKTSYIDLTKSEEDLIASFDPEIRRCLRKSGEKGITTHIIESFEKIYPLLSEAGKRRHFFVQPFTDWLEQWGCFGKELKVILAYQNNELLGGNMSLLKPPMAFGLFLPTTDSGKHKHAAPILVWEGLKLAKERGCTLFDLDGLYDARYKFPKKWIGLSTFKKQFHGKEVEFIATKIKIYAWFLKPFGWFRLL